MLHFARWKTGLILLVCLFGITWASPNLLTDSLLEKMPASLNLQRMHLGLDLQGGSHMLFEIDMDSLEEEQLNNVADDVRAAFRNRESRIGYRALRVEDGAVRFSLRNPADADKARAALEETVIQTLPPEALTTGVLADNLALDLTDPSNAVLSFTEEYFIWKRQQTVAQTIEVVRNRIDALGTTEPTIVQSGAGRVLVQVPGLDDPQRLKDLIGTAARMTFHLVDVDGSAPASRSIVLPQKDQPGDLKLFKRVEIEGDRLTDAAPSFNQFGEPAVSIRFDARGAKAFADITTQNVNRPFAIVLDGVILTAPNINEPILGGSAIITGSFTVQEANDLALVLRSGALPASLNILEERSVGPSLGADSVEAGKWASVVGLGLVLIFMVVVYGRFGFYSDIALAINITLIVAVLSLLQATLTLPGIGGIVLTIGMAVDANVLIFERIREEMAAGKKPWSAIESGYKRAIETILDANITTFIAAIILFVMGTGPVRGFAVTLGIGIVTSVFTAFTVTRLMIAFYMNRKRPTEVTL